MKSVTRYIFGAAFVLAGINHFVNPDFYVRIMPPYLPWHRELVYASGVAEVLLGTMLWVRRWSRMAAWGQVALLVGVFTANVYMATHPELFADVASPALLWLRLPLQAVLMAWAWWYTRDVSAPPPTRPRSDR